MILRIFTPPNDFSLKIPQIHGNQHTNTLMSLIFVGVCTLNAKLLGNTVYLGLTKCLLALLRLYISAISCFPCEYIELLSHNAVFVLVCR